MLGKRLYIIKQMRRKGGGGVQGYSPPPSCQLEFSLAQEKKTIVLHEKQ